MTLIPEKRKGRVSEGVQEYKPQSSMSNDITTYTGKRFVPTLIFVELKRRLLLSISHLKESTGSEKEGGEE